MPVASLASEPTLWSSFRVKYGRIIIIPMKFDILFWVHRLIRQENVHGHNSLIERSNGVASSNYHLETSESEWLRNERAGICM